MSPTKPDNARHAKFHPYNTYPQTISLTAATTADCNLANKPVPKVFTCDTCSRSFTTACHLRRHDRVHAGVKGHRCPFPGCETSCSRLDNLQQHYRIHMCPGAKGTRITTAMLLVDSRTEEEKRRCSAPPIVVKEEDTAYDLSMSEYPSPPNTPPPLEQAPLQVLLQYYYEQHPEELPISHSSPSPVPSPSPLLQTSYSELASAGYCLTSDEPTVAHIPSPSHSASSVPQTNYSELALAGYCTPKVETDALEELNLQASPSTSTSSLSDILSPCPSAYASTSISSSPVSSTPSTPFIGGASSPYLDTYSHATTTYDQNHSPNHQSLPFSQSTPLSSFTRKAAPHVDILVHDPHSNPLYINSYESHRLAMAFGGDYNFDYGSESVFTYYN